MLCGSSQARLIGAAHETARWWVLETTKARMAFNDYLAMGDDRSLEKLCQEYQSRTGKAPTRQLSRLKRWSADFKWQERLAEIAERERAAIQAEGIANRQNRIDSYNDTLARLEQIIRERAADAQMVGVAGGETGLLVAEPMLVKVYDSGDKDGDTLKPIKLSQIEYKYALDTGLLKALLDVKKQAAIELGQWEEKSQISGATLIREYGVNVEAV